MSDWVCHDCGTINHDPLDIINVDILDHPQTQKYMKAREEAELKGERFLRCMCGEYRK